MQPDWEAPWLVLAAVSDRHAGMAYLQHALVINPDSRHAKAGLAWMQAHPADPLGMPSRPMVQGRAAPAPPPLHPSVEIPENEASEKEDAPDRPAMKRRLVRRPLALLISSLAFLLILTVVLWPRLNLPAQASQQPTPTMTPVAALETGLTPALVQSSLQSDLPAPVPTEAAPSIPILTPTSGTIQLPTITPQYMQSLISGEYVSDRIPADGEKSIVINISEQRLYAYQGGTLVFQFIVSTGANNGTRTGTFSILDKLPKAYDADWNFWMPDWMGIYYAGTYEDGIHTLPILTDGQRIWGNSLGTPVTYGCVVLGISESHLLYDWAEVGTPVQINP